MRTHSSLSLPLARLAYFALLSLVYIVGKGQYSSNLLLPWLLLLLMPPGYFLSFGSALRSKRERERWGITCKLLKMVVGKEKYSLHPLCVYAKSVFLFYSRQRFPLELFVVCVRTDGRAAAGSSGGCSVSAWLVARRCVVYAKPPQGAAAAALPATTTSLPLD